MIVSKDYHSYYSENTNILELLHENNSILYERIKDCIKVLDYICYQFDNGHPINEDLENIFEVGFSYFHEQTELIKLYFKEYFKEDYILFKHYETIINYLLFIDDFSEALDEKGYYDNKAKNTLTQLTNQLEDILKKKSKFNDDIIKNVNVGIESCTPHKVDIITTDVVFSYILEELE